jgi:hypothetical protein
MQQKVLYASMMAALGMASLQAQAEGFVTLSGSGSPVASICQGVQEPDPEAGAGTTNCKIQGSLPTGTSCAAATSFGAASSGVTGVWVLWRQANTNAIKPKGNADVTVGNLEDRVWRRCTAVGGTLTNDYIFGMRVSLNTTDWTEPTDDNLGLTGAQGCDGQVAGAFEVNDVSRTGFSAVTTVQTGYRQGTGDEGAWRSSRSNQSLAQLLAAGGTALTDPTRDNNWVSYRTDVSPEDPDGISFNTGSWLLTKVTLSAEPVRVTNAINLTQGGEEGQCKYRTSVSGYRP